MDPRGGSGGEHVEPGESIRNASRAVFHVDDNEVVAGEIGDLGEGRGEAEEEETVQDQRSWFSSISDYGFGFGFDFGFVTLSFPPLYFFFFVLFFLCFFSFRLFSVWPQ